MPSLQRQETAATSVYGRYNWRAGASQPSRTTGTNFLFICFGRSTYCKCFYVTLNLRVRMQYFTTRTIIIHVRSTSSAVRFYVASTSSAVPLCLRQFGFRSDSKCYKPAQHTTTGWRTYKDSTTINYTCCKDLACGLHA